MRGATRGGQGVEGSGKQEVAGVRGRARRPHASRPTGERWEMTGSGAGLGRPGGLASWAATGEAR